MMRRRFFLVWILCCSPVRADFEISDWKFWAPLELPEEPIRDVHLVRITLPGEILARLGDQLQDLRVVDSLDVEIPYALVVETSTSREEVQPTRILNLSVLPGQYQQVVGDLGENAGTSNLVRFKIEARDYFRRVDILGSSDAENWLELRSGARVFDHFEQLQYRNTQVSYPESNFRFLKAVVWLDGSQPIPIDALEVVRVRRVEVPRETLPARISRIEQDVERKATDLFLETDLGRQHFSICRLGVRQGNFRRAAGVSVRLEDGRWEVAGSGYIHRLSAGDWVEENLEIPLSDLNHSNVRLRIFNEDNPPLDVSSVVFERDPHALFFEAARSRNYRLFFGNLKAALPSYDLSALAAGRLDPRAFPEVRAGAPRVNPAYRERQLVPPWTDRHPLILWMGLGLGVVALIWMLRRTLAEMGSSAE